MRRNSRSRFLDSGEHLAALRQLHESIKAAPALLFRPQTAWRVRWNTNTDTPLPPDEPGGENPPDSAIIDYYVGTSQPALVTLEIKDQTGQLVRRYSSADPVPTPDSTLAIPIYWIRPPQKLASNHGIECRTVRAV